MQKERCVLFEGCVEGCEIEKREINVVGSGCKRIKSEIMTVVNERERGRERERDKRGNE